MLMLSSIDLEGARRIVAAGEKQAAAINLPVNLAVVDVGGNLVTHARMDGALLCSIDHSIDKAFTSAMVRCPTGDLAEPAQSGGSLYGLDNTIGGRLITFAGGLPIFVEGQVVGGLGVSGGTAEQDLQIAEAALEGLESGK